MAWHTNSDLEFLRRLSSSDLKDLFDALVYDEDNTTRMNEELTDSTEYKRYGRDYAKYPTRIAEELQCYGGNTFINFFRNEGVLYKEILCEVRNKLKVNYNKKSDTTLIEENMLSSILQKSLEEMDDKEVKEMCDELSIKNTDNLNRQALSAATLTLFKAGGSHSYALAIAVADAMVRQTLGHGLSSVVGKVVLKKTLGILAGPIGWVITGALVSINLAGPAYRVTIPACVLIAALRLKLEQEAKQKAEREANKTKKYGIWLSSFSLV
ncbi:DUF3944 domain-containing protein [Helicobacter pylori]|nr:hypothetical protein C2S19_00310 [Helicobacter pylori]WQX24284.1 DUF3944 domain-containing protein [Helicobacter pylori]